MSADTQNPLREGMPSSTATDLRPCSLVIFGASGDLTRRTLVPAVYNLALSRLSLSLHALLNAGVPVVRAWPLAAAASGSVRLKREVASWPPLIEEGVTPAQLLAESRVFPELFSTMYNTGEISGTIDDSLIRLQRLHQERGTMQFRIIADWLPKIVYFAIVIYVAYSVVSFYLGYYGQIGDILQ